MVDIKPCTYEVHPPPIVQLLPSLPSLNQHITQSFLLRKVDYISVYLPRVIRQPDRPYWTASMITLIVSHPPLLVLVTRNKLRWKNTILLLPVSQKLRGISKNFQQPSHHHCVQPPMANTEHKHQTLPVFTRSL